MTTALFTMPLTARCPTKEEWTKAGRRRRRSKRQTRTRNTPHLVRLSTWRLGTWQSRSVAPLRGTQIPGGLGEFGLPTAAGLRQNRRGV